MQLSDNEEAAAEAIIKLGRGVDTRKGRPQCNKRPKTYTNWFTPELWPPIDAALKRYGRSYSKKEIVGWRHTAHFDTVWNGRKELEIEFINLLNELMDASVGFNSVIIQFQLKAFLQVRCPEILREAGGNFDVSRSFVKKWVKDRLGWSYRKATTPAPHLPSTWKDISSAGASRKAEESSRKTTKDFPAC
ncbi:hypothetical protein R1sor_026164 [Riccia sorocarpa]|uniref:Transposase n=1 Tax=Riccia sorocarpa TaxID=122646 RepID=A0ABD3GC76_9MARC